MQTPLILTTVLVLAASLGYSLATIGMKLASNHLSYLAIALLIGGFAASALAEIVLMRGISLGALYMTIIAVETLIVLGYAISIGEGLQRDQMLGGAMIFVGLVIVGLGEQA